jgi:hypothetical protein
MHPQDFWWIYEANLPPDGLVTDADKWQSLYEKLG